MIKDITIGQFFPGNSVIHKLDPRIKLVLTFVYCYCFSVQKLCFTCFHCSSVNSGNTFI